MTNSNLLASARAAVVGIIDPDAYAAGTYTTGWIDMQDWFSLLAIIMVGDFAATSTLNAKFQQATDGSGTGAKDITGAAITALTQAGPDDNKQALINLDQGSLDYNNGFRYVRLSMTVATAAADSGAIVLGLDPRNGAANASDIAAVDEIAS
jgi:hypothetical protein